MESPCYDLQMEPLMKDVSLADLDLFLRVGKLRSLRECARQLGMTPGAISKIIRRLEGRLERKLIKRSVSGILLTPDGNELIDVAQNMVQLMTAAQPRGSRPRAPARKVWGIGSISFLSTRLIPKALGELEKARPDAGFRVIEFTHNELVAHGLNGAFEISLHIDPLEWTRVWSSQYLGKLSWGLYARTGHVLATPKQVSELDVITHPFVMPVGWTENGFAKGEDHCPIPWGRRFAGHEASMAETALEIVMVTDHLTFVPDVLAQTLVEAGLVKRIKVTEWPEVDKRIYLSVRDDLVSKPFLKSLVSSLGNALKV